MRLDVLGETFPSFFRKVGWVKVRGDIFSYPIHGASHFARKDEFKNMKQVILFVLNVCIVRQAPFLR